MALNATITPFPADFEVWEVRFSDRMNQPFDLLVRGGSTASNVDVRTLLGHRMTLSLPDEALLSSVNGIVRRAGKHAPEPDGVTMYEFQIAPAEWALTKRTNSRIFQKKTAVEIALSILGDHPITTLPAEFVRKLPAREYCVQYDETDHDFVHRLLAEEGIAAFFDHSAGGRWTLLDDTTLQKPSTDRDMVAHVNVANLKPGALAVLRWRWEELVEPVVAIRRDYDFQRPLLTLEQAAAAPPSAFSPTEAPLEEYVFEPGRLLTPNADGKETARDIEATRARAQVVHLETNFAAGAGMSLHVDGDELTGDWLVIGAEVVLQSSPTPTGGIVNRRATSASVIPLAAPYRSQRRKRPLIFGTQSARVVGGTPEGTVDVDELGRVNVEFRWDRRDLWATNAPGKGNPTRRVRVVQAWAGPGYGFVTLPRVGDEVIVAYSDGNPDEPLVIGRVHNAVSATPLSLPDEHKTVTAWKSQSFGPNGPVEGNNFITMDDQAGAEMLAFRAQHDMSTVVVRNASTEIGADQRVKISGSQSLGVSGGQSANVGEIASLTAKHILVTANGTYYLMAQYVTLSSAGFFGIDAVGERLDRSAVKHHFESPAIFIHGKDGVQVVTDKFHVHANSEVLLQSQGSSIQITPGGIKISSPGPVEINGTPIKLNC
jgi:type VI secretion system secreted protein VgrG